ncbi:Cyclic-di-AMP phosphodiesterase PgpH [termite gut metagenome]|uniref:Cyclic-di-AMP phosphodiesterase PgpH n=1 Tax=termite gut metagenome TaxID=433724 RepID=A0A5J4T1N4_9ZZZZ
MAKNSEEGNTRKDWIYKCLLFVATISLIVYFLPREGEFNYHFDINRPWKYEPLIATFDFSISKNEATIKREQDSIRAFFQPYYQRNRSVEKEVFEQFEKSYDVLLSFFLSADDITYLKKRLESVYEVGIVSTEDAERLQKEGTVSIQLVDKRTSNRKTVNLFTVEEAYEYVFSPDTFYYYRKNILYKYPFEEYHLLPNLILDEQRTVAAEEKIFAAYSQVSGRVQSGQKIVDKGEIINEQTYVILESLRKEVDIRSESPGQKHIVLVGQLLFTCLLLLFLMTYLELFRRCYYERKYRRSVLLLFVLVVFYCVITSLNFFNVYTIPYTMIPIIIRVFLDSRTAFMTHLITILICSVTVSFPYEFVLFQLCAGLVSIFSLRELSQRSQLIQMSFFIMLTYMLTFCAYELIKGNDVFSIPNLHTCLCFVVNALLLLFVYPLLFILEKVFGFTSSIALVELSNINNRLLRRMSEEAPGTFQHSMQVANLATEAAIRIGAKSQLVRTGALYHDIGKMENPAFFTENQSGFNPHSTLDYEQSAHVVINHVPDGLRLAEKDHLPQAIKNFIRTHHGKGKTKYFYVSWKNEHPDEEPEEGMFTYPGPNPFSRETAILMMADAVEATSRSLSEYTDDSIGIMVERIIDAQIQEGFFKECPLTFKDISTIKTVFKEKLKTIYHTRISYPELKNC